MRRILKEIALATWLPATAGALTFAITWLVWFMVDPICVPMPDAPCPRLPWGRYITPAILGQCIFHTFLATSITGGSDIMLFIREFRNREKEQAAAAARLEQQRAEASERYDQQQKINAQQRADDQKRYDQMHAQMLERLERSEAMTQQLIQQATEERRADREERREERRQYESRMAEAISAAEARIEARLAAEERIRRLETQLAQQQANGNNGSANPNP